MVQKTLPLLEILKDESPKHLFNRIPKLTRLYSTRTANNIPHLKIKHNFFENTFFMSVNIEWNKLAPEIQYASSLNVFKNNILKFIRPTANNIFGFHNKINEINLQILNASIEFILSSKRSDEPLLNFLHKDQ